MSELAQRLIEQEERQRTGYLDLGNCGLTEMPDLSGLDWLDTLIFSDRWRDWGKRGLIYSKNEGPRNRVTQFETARFPKSLRKIILSELEISDGTFLSKMTTLTTLDLNGNQIRSGSFVGKLTNLTTLNLGSTRIREWLFLGKLSNLTALDLSGNQIWIGSFLSNLSNLTMLNLSGNQIRDWSYLSKMPNLTALDLSGNQISDGSYLAKMANLTTLDLSGNYIRDWSFLENLIKLTTLDLSGNQISGGYFLRNLTNLTTLKLSGNRIGDGSFLNKLTNLTTLDLSGNQISDMAFLENLTKLTTLKLSGNRIGDGSFLNKLTNLTTLDLSGNQISDMAFLENLTKLTTLKLSGNRIGDGSFLNKLPNLTALDLSGNQISDGSYLAKMANLTTLDLSGNYIRDWSFLENLIKLTTLDLSGNQISGGYFLRNLTNLTTLKLSGNRIGDGSFLNKLTNLTTLDLSGNQINDFEHFRFLAEEKGLIVVWKEMYEIGIGEINLKNNPFKNPGVEVVKQGNAAILDYFKQKQKGQKLLLEAKLVLLGDGRAGKTSLANRLLNKPLPTESDRTKGVDIIIGEYQFEVAGEDFKLHIWDFAGQDKYKPLHQFFYTEGAVYVMVADSGNARTDFDDWFQTAELFGAGSPLLVVLNEFSETMGKSTFDEDHWRKQFPKLIKEVCLVNLLSQKGVPQLEKSLCYFAENLPHAKTQYPKNWADIRSELERRRDENYISVQEYFRVCEQNDLIGEESALILSSILHKIGVCLHYQHNPLLEQFVILKNEWATQAVYRILEDEMILEQKKGFFDRNDLERIWLDATYRRMLPQLLELMQQFKMAYALPNRKEFITPPLLPPVPPDDWKFPDGDSLELFVEYEFLPKALLTQFIVTRHTDIDRGRTLVWRNGVVLRWSNHTFAEITKTKSQGRHAFNIRAMGSNRRGLLTSILKSLRDLHEEYKGIRSAEIVACPCSDCRSGKNKQHYFEFEILTNRLEKGYREAECQRSMEKLDLMKLIGDLLVVEQLGVGQKVVLKDVKNEKLETQKPDKTIRVFLASSAELAEDRNKLRAFFSEKNDRYKKSGNPNYLMLENWEAMSGTMSETRKQDDYNKRIPECDLFVCLSHTKVGKYTEEEFDLAWATFQETGKPKILTCFKTEGVNPLSVQSSLRDFNKKLTETLDHFPDSYTSYADLERKIWKELEIFLS
ncbi:leucine-rich repeat domain-containing protein [Salmonirosea aquatica]|uniref:GTP-binding protein n=1 Tax=Salmonirosea aquatica TaxID=2654236 RepID=A0A7C9FCK2_9BACT|nr:GTP-binding protein [Cytophagaceae bacterium SJW1-29]